MLPKVAQLVLDSTRPQYTKPLSIKGSFLFLSDVEIPFHNAPFINQCLQLAKHHNIKQAVFGGDLLHLEAFSPFWGADTNATQEVLEVEEYLPGLLEPFKQIYYFMGNHDARLQRSLQVRVSNEKALRLAIPDKLFNKILFSEYYWMKAEGNWLLEHQVNNSTIPTRIAQGLSAKFGANVITGHTHKSGMVRVNGLWAIDAGCCVDAERLAYTSIRHSTHTQMQNGAVLMEWFKDGYVPTLLNPESMEYHLWQARKGR